MLEAQRQILSHVVKDNANPATINEIGLPCSSTLATLGICHKAAHSPQ